jgi:hypothetical protein
VLDIKINAASVDTGSGMKKSKLKSKDFFDVKDNPYITFHSTKIEQTGSNSFDVSDWRTTCLIFGFPSLFPLQHPLDIGRKFTQPVGAHAKDHLGATRSGLAGAQVPAMTPAPNAPAYMPSCGRKCCTRGS